MIRIDFSNSSRGLAFWETLRGVCANDLRPLSGVLVLSAALLATICVVEKLRWHEAEVRTKTLESRAAAATREVAALEARVASIGTLERALAGALRIRQSNIQRAKEIVAIGNALPDGVALTTLRETGNGWQIQGRCRHWGEVAESLERIRRLPPSPPAKLVEANRDEHQSTVISFELEVGRRPPQGTP